MPQTPRQAAVHITFAVLVTLGCAALFSAAALVPAPHIVLPLLVVVCIGMPMAVATDLPASIATLRSQRAVSTLRRHLARLPETPHPIED